VGAETPMSKELLKINADDIRFLEDSFIAIEDYNFTSDFGNWIQKKEVELKYTPAVVLVDPSGKVVFAQSMTREVFYANFAKWLKDQYGKL